MHYKMQLRGIFLTWCTNTNFTSWISDSIYPIKSMISITNIFVSKFIVINKNYFVVWLWIRYWQFVNEFFCDGLKCNTLGGSDFWRFCGCLILWVYFFKITFRLKSVKFLVNFGEFHTAKRARRMKKQSLLMYINQKVFGWAVHV